MNCVLMKIISLKAVFQLIQNVRQVESNSDCNENNKNNQLVEWSLNPEQLRCQPFCDACRMSLWLIGKNAVCILEKLQY